MLAKEATTLDLLSGGRLEFGIGAGWSRRDYQQLGIPYDAPKVRVDRMEEAVALIKRLWTEEKVTHEGPHYRVRDAVVLPRPTQRPHPPLMIGASGSRMLRIAAREAQIVAFVPSLNRLGLSTLGSISAEFIEKRVAMLRRAPLCHHRAAQRTNVPPWRSSQPRCHRECECHGARRHLAVLYGATATALPRRA